MQIREAKLEDAVSWAEMRLELWAGSLEQHLIEIEEYFAGSSMDIVKTYVLVNENDALIGFLELNIRNFAEGSRFNTARLVSKTSSGGKCRI